jgi:protein SCO1
MSLAFVDATGRQRTLAQAIGGRPAILILADYTCQTLCGPIVSFAASALDRSGLDPGREYRMVVVGLDPKDGPAPARAMKNEQIGEATPLAAATTFLSSEENSLTVLKTSLGYRDVHDSENDQFAHPAALFVLSADGRVARVLSGLGIDPADLRLALVEAGDGRIGGIADKVQLLCYGFDPALGIYTSSIQGLLRVGWLVTAIGLAGVIGLMTLKRRASQPGG